MLVLRTLATSSQNPHSFWITLVTLWDAGYLIHPGFVSDLVGFAMNSFLLQSFLEGRQESGSYLINKKRTVKYFNICTAATLEMNFTALQSEGDSVLRILMHWQTEELFKVDCNVCGCWWWESEFYKCIMIILYVAERRDM